MALSVIGSGLGRTGTMSLKIALEQLGLGPCHHMVEVFKQPESTELWVSAGAGRPDWDAIFTGFGSAVDYPSCRFWRELIAYYPDAKVIHTVRDPARWFESTQATIFNPKSPAADRDSPFAAFFGMVTSDFAGRMDDRDFLLDYFRRHNEAVLATVPRDRLLVFEAAQGWEPLCAFLGVPVPDAEFPRENSSVEFQKRHFEDDAGPPPA
jgi:hypothetical protein